MELVKKTVRKSLFLLFPLAALSFFAEWKSEDMGALKLFGDPGLIPISILMGGIIAIANLRGMVWGIEGMLGSHKANTRLVFFSLVRLFVLFGLIILLVLLKLVNLLGLLIGMSVVFIVMIREAMKMAKEEGQGRG